MPADPRNALARALAETHLECLSAEHDYQKTLNDGHDFLQSRSPFSKLKEHPEQLDLVSWHYDALREATERGGIGEVPELPYIPQMPPQ
jgi:hypothetical protein